MLWFFRDTLIVSAGHRNMHGCPGIFKGMANAIFSYQEILSAIGDLTRLELQESDTDEELEGHRQSLIRKMSRNNSGPGSYLLWHDIYDPITTRL